MVEALPVTDDARVRNVEFIPRGRKAPMLITRAEGNYLYTAAGQQVLDAAGGAMLTNIGHGRAEVADATAASLKNLSYTVPPFATPERMALIERLTDKWLPEGMNRVWFGQGGSDTIEAALRLAITHHSCSGKPDKTTIIGRQRAYHGTTMYALAAGDHPGHRKHLAGALVALPHAAAPDCTRCPETDHRQCALRHAADLAAIIERQGAHTIAAFIAEPMSGTTLACAEPPEGRLYWQRIREICDEHDILLIADEVMVGFGRTGKRFCSEHFDLKSDIMVAGKGLTAGYAALTGLYTRNAVTEPLTEDGHEIMFHSFGGLPSACAAADKVLEIYEREDLVARAAAMGAYLQSALRRRLDEHPHVYEVRGRGLLIGVELVQDRASHQPFADDTRIAHRLIAEGFRRGVSFYPAGCAGYLTAVCIGPPFTITEPECDRIAEVFAESLDAAVQKARH